MIKMLIKKGNTYDEIMNYIDARYLAASEATWRLFGFKNQEKSPAVHALPVHLPDEHTVFFNDSSNIKRVLFNQTQTKLLAYFETNAEEKQTNLSLEKRSKDGKLQPNGFELTYHEFPK